MQSVFNGTNGQVSKIEFNFSKTTNDPSFIAATDKWAAVRCVLESADSLSSHSNFVEYAVENLPKSTAVPNSQSVIRN